MASQLRTGLTEQQRQAIRARGVSVALSAGAGCGKTFVLTERFLSHLEPDGDGQPAKLGELVAITFTERAAREMRDRIRKACRRRLLECSDGEAAHWLTLVRQLDAARISTIHAFCGELLRDFAVEAGLDPQFRVLPQAQAELLLYELIDDQLRNRLAARDEATIDLVIQFGLDQVRRMIAVLLGHRQEIDWARWRQLTADELVARWQVYWRQVTVPELVKWLSESPDARAAFQLVREHPPTNAVMARRCQVLTDCFAQLATSADPLSQLDVLVESARVQGGGGKDAWPSEEIYRQFRDAAARLRKACENTRSHLAFATGDARPAAEAGLRLLEISAGVNEVYERKKQELAGLDFDDLLIRTRRLLTDPNHRELQQRLAAGIRLLLVDEFQDTDPLQVELVEALAGGQMMQGKLFFVGDYKQSIYRFRGADPRVFRQLREATPSEGRLPLTRNFRSQPAILDFVNALFCDDLGPQYEPLVASRPQIGPEPAIELIWATEEDPHGRSGQKDRLRQLEADWIARRLRGMLDSDEKLVWDSEASRPTATSLRILRQGDIALLFRALSDVQYYEEALRRYGIDYYLVGGHAFYAQQEIYDLLNLLRAVASPSDEVSLAGVLRSPMFSLEDETLFWLARHPAGLRGGLVADELPAELSRDQLLRVQFAALVIGELRRQKDRLPVADLIQLALDRTGYDAVILAEFLGERKLANLRKLIDQARSLDRSGAFSLWDFITQLAEFVARQPDEPLAATHPESTDVVRLMTIHQSKGLEFPVVVVPDIDRRMQGPVSPVAFSPELGPLVRTSGPDGYQLYARASKDEELAEILRLLYVATTRAADRLILTAGVPQLGAAGGPWTELLNRRWDPLTGELRAVLPTEYPAPKISVTTSQPPLARKAVLPQGRHELDKIVQKARTSAARKTVIPPWLEAIPAGNHTPRHWSISRWTGELIRGRLETSADPRRAKRNDGDGELEELDALVHVVLANVASCRAADAEAAVQRHANWYVPAVMGSLNQTIEMVRRFLNSPRAESIFGAREIHRELDFLLAWPLGTQAPEPVCLEGVIDCLYQDGDGGWHLVDYRTHRLDAEEARTAATRYEMQLLVYGLAVEQVLGRPPEEMVLSFLWPGVEHRLTWNGEARQRVLKWIEGEMAK